MGAGRRTRVRAYRSARLFATAALCARAPSACTSCSRAAGAQHAHGTPTSREARHARRAKRRAPRARPPLCGAETQPAERCERMHARLERRAMREEAGRQGAKKLGDKARGSMLIWC
eukprot:1869811-Pleurochrysis_carterae.AAC.1